MSELKKTEPITQANLPEALKKGLISQQEVERIWHQTEYLSAQTPIEVRVAVIKMLEAGYAVTPSEQMLLSAVLDLRATLYRDESKFAHLVAGTETIVKTLQNVNPLMRHLERQEALIDSLNEQLLQVEAKLDTVMRAIAEGGKLEIKHEVVHGGDEEAEYLAETAAKAIDEHQSPQAQPTEETYDANVGSAWDPKNPAQPARKFPTSKEEYETQAQRFRERILKNS